MRLPPFQSVDTCSGVCSVGNVDMSVWSLSGSGRLNEQTMPLAEVDLTINSDVNTWPRSLGAAELADNLRAFHPSRRSSFTISQLHYVRASRPMGGWLSAMSQ